MKRILFSPIGTTDPIRDCYDGACLHIIRHYRPDEVVLFFTAEMGELQKKDQRYTKAVKQLAPGISIREIYSEIKDAHLYDSYFEIVPRCIRELEQEDAELLLNLSSGTPQIKTMMAILTVQEKSCRGIQVSSPSKKSNVNSDPVKPDYDVDEALQNNLDDCPDAENRCSEPPLKVLRHYAERKQLLSLIGRYEYGAARTLVKGSDTVPETVQKLLEHASLRIKLQPDKAKKVLSRYENIRLFAFEGEEEKLMEYFLLMQVAQRKELLSDLLVKLTPFLYELLQLYLKKNTRFSLREITGRKKLERGLLQKYQPRLLELLDKEWEKWGGYRDSELSARLLYHICQYVCREEMAKDSGKHERLVQVLDKISKGFDLRNDVAHTIVNFLESDFVSRTGVASGQMINCLAELLEIVLGKEAASQRKIYETINRWIDEQMT